MSLKNLPNELILKIAKYCEGKTFLALKYTDKNFLRILSRKETDRKIRENEREIERLKRKLKLGQKVIEIIRDEDFTYRWDIDHYQAVRLQRMINNLSEKLNYETDIGEPRYVLNVIYDWKEINQGGIYLSQRMNPEKDMFGMWQTPGGKVEENESPIDAVIRETKEETGIQFEKEQAEFMFNDPEFDCDVYFTYCNKQSLLWTEKHNMGPWILFSLDDYLHLTLIQKTTTTHNTYGQYIIERVYDNLRELRNFREN